MPSQRVDLGKTDAVEDFVESLTRGNVAEVKTILASVAVALACYQVFLAAVGYGRLRLRFLSAPPAFFTHRVVGGTILLLVLAVGAMCLATYGFDDDGLTHGLTGLGLLVALGIKVAVVRRGLGLGRVLPMIGLAVFTLLAVTWTLSAGDFLGES